MRELVIIGAGGFAKEVHWLVSEIKKTRERETLSVKGFISNSPPRIGRTLSILGDDAWAFQHLSREIGITVAIGNPSVRASIVKQYEQQGFFFESLSHPSVRSSSSVFLGNGSILCAGSTMTTDIVVGKQVIINLHCTVGHDASIGDFCTLAPGVHVSGEVHIEEGCEIGSGAVLLPGVRIGQGCRVGAGAVVTKDLEAGGTYSGVPARRHG